MKKFLDVFRSKSKQRSELDHGDSGRTSGCVISYPALGNTQAFGDVLGGQKALP
jgi:hypothetical protein